MKSSLLSGLGIDPAYLLIALFVIQIITVIYVIKLHMDHKRMKVSYNSFMRGKYGKTLESSIQERFDELEKLQVMTEQNKKDILELSAKCKTHYQKVGIVRYDAFQEMGGDLSFALTMLDEENNGWILNVMHSRDACYNYIKEVIHGESYIELAEEEIESLERAVYQEQYDLKKTTTGK